LSIIITNKCAKILLQEQVSTSAKKQMLGGLIEKQKENQYELYSELINTKGWMNGTFI
jgi:hypothetical protein